ncbi:MAG TPA: hypothetical protein PKD00_08225 [Burkholderiales bacterium]|nr:hypothetical protein [Burkholderiales bacterium]
MDTLINITKFQVFAKDTKPDNLFKKIMDQITLNKIIENLRLPSQQNLAIS